MSFIEITQEESDRMIELGAFGILDTNGQEYILFQNHIFIVSKRTTEFLKESMKAKDGYNAENL